MSFELIETKTLASAQASIEFTSIPQDGTDLVLVVSGRSTYNSTDCDIVTMRFNGTSTGYSGRRLYGIPPSTVGSDTNSSSGTLLAVGPISAAQNTANTFGSTNVYISNYTAAINKSTSSESVSETNATANQMEIYAGLWSNTAAITSITLGLQNGANNYVAGSTVSLYKITKGSGGATVS